MKSIGLYAVIFFISVSAFAQSDTEPKLVFKGDRTYSKAVICLDNPIKTVYTAEPLKIKDDVLSFQPADVFSKGKGQQDLSLQQISYIKAKTGTKALGWGIGGALLGALTGFLGAAQGVNDAETQALAQGKTVTNGDEIMRGFAIGGGVLGLLLGAAYGASQETWSVIYDKNAIKVEKPYFNFNTKPANGELRLSMMMNF